MDQLPDYMQVSYKALLEVYSEIEEQLANKEKLYRIYYAREAMKTQAKNYLLEAKWLHQKHIPTMDEYMAVSLLSTGYPALITTSFVGMGDIATQDSFDWLATYPRAVKGAAVVCRLMDDVVSRKFEQKRGHVCSALECYMKEYGGTEEEAIVEFHKQLSDAWKDIHESFLLPTITAVVPMPLLTGILNLACVMDVVYKHEDGYSTHHGTVLKDLIVSTLVQPVPV